jgi:hypothetical protein
MTDHGQGNEQGAFAFLALLGFVPVGVVRLEMAARLAEPWQVGLIGAIVFLGAWLD